MTERHEQVNTMAEIILQRPAVTARQLAHALDFAQERSVYYWLRKAGFRGLTDFRTAVLTGEYPVATEASTGPVALRATHVAEVPLLAAERPPTGSTPLDYVITTRSVSRDAFAVTIESDEYRPLVERNDILLIDPDERLADGDLALVQPGPQHPILCRIYASPKRWYVHPVTGRPIDRPRRNPSVDVRLLGRVIGLQRSY